MEQPVPFEIVRAEGSSPVATNGTSALVVMDGGEIRLRRAIRTSSTAPVAERMLPQLNALAGDLLANSAMTPHELAARLHALQLSCLPPLEQNVEWAFGELDGVRCFFDGKTAVLTKQDIQV